MASFDLVLPIILKNEGGYVDDPTDPGGETNKGITMKTFQQCSHALLGVDPTSANLKALTDAQAGIIYKTNYWNPIQGDAYPSQDLANIVCDFYVNSGTHATSLLQRVLNSLGASLTVDGSIGPATIQALATIPGDQIYRAYKQGRIAYYTELGQRYPQFLKGWLRRVNEFPDVTVAPPKT
jgi:lysozyme family protein